MRDHASALQAKKSCMPYDEICVLTYLPFLPGLGQPDPWPLHRALNPPRNRAWRSASLSRLLAKLLWGYLSAPMDKACGANSFCMHLSAWRTDRLLRADGQQQIKMGRRARTGRDGRQHLQRVPTSSLDPRALRLSCRSDRDSNRKLILLTPTVTGFFS